MKIAVYGNQINRESLPHLKEMYQVLNNDKVTMVVYRPLLELIRKECDWLNDAKDFSDYQSLIRHKPQFIITLGGDGTILKASTIIADSGIPVLGVNTGRLGFLANVQKEKVGEAAKKLISGEFRIRERNLLQVTTSEGDILQPNFALNELTISRKETTSMITVHAYINDEYLNSYWADGLIVATPTGSTGYSLSCGGPIIMPGSENFVITPIAPHNLNMRPFVIPNHFKIRLRVESREDSYLATLDSRLKVLKNNVEIFLERAPFKLKMIETDIQDFAVTLRSKLYWGVDKRN